MSALTDRIADQHVYIWSAAHCSCGTDVWGEDYAEHIASATEAAVRAQIAEEIATYGERDIPCWRPEPVRFAVSDAYASAIRVAMNAEGAAVHTRLADAWDEGYEAGSGAVADLFHGRPTKTNPHKGGAA